MEDYSESSKQFEQFMSHLTVDVLGLKFKDCIDYSKMMNIMLINDMHSEYNAHEAHITRNAKENDKEKEIDLLLSIKYVLDEKNNIVVDVCQKIKNMTIGLEYEWKYTDYC